MLERKMTLYAIIGRDATTGLKGIVAVADSSGFVGPLVTTNKDLFNESVLDYLRQHINQSWSEIYLYTFESVDKKPVRGE